MALCIGKKIGTLWDTEPLGIYQILFPESSQSIITLNSNQFADERVYCYFTMGLISFDPEVLLIK